MVTPERQGIHSAHPYTKLQNYAWTILKKLVMEMPGPYTKRAIARIIRPMLVTWKLNVVA